jgi:hypothetical protein
MEPAFFAYLKSKAYTSFLPTFPLTQFSKLLPISHLYFLVSPQFPKNTSSRQISAMESLKKHPTELQGINSLFSSIQDHQAGVG